MHRILKTQINNFFFLKKKPDDSNYIQKNLINNLNNIN